MIQEIFIATPGHRVLFGDASLYPESPAYPVDSAAGGRLCQLRVNDVVLAILYRNMDSFSAAKCLHDLRGHIEDRLVELTEKNVRSHYFAILELLQDAGALCGGEEARPLRLLPSDSTYIDVVESVHAVVLGDGTVLENSIFGHVLLSRPYAGRLRMAVDKGSRYRIACKSSHELVDGLDRAEVVGSGVSSASALLCYSIARAGAVLFSMRRTDSRYTFVCAGRLRFRFVQFEIPVPRTTFAAELRASTGRAEFDMEGSRVVWDVGEGVFAEESIVVERHALEEYVDARPVLVHFAAPEWTESALRIEGCCGEESPADKFWVTYTTQDGHYEIRG